MCSNWFSFFFIPFSFSLFPLHLWHCYVHWKCHLKLFIIITCPHNCTGAYIEREWKCECVWTVIILKAKLETTTFFFANVHAVQNVVEKNLICANIQVFICESMVSMHVFCDRHHWILTQFDGVLVLGFWNMQPNVQLVGTEGWYSNENIIYKLYGLNNFHWYLLFRYFTHMCMYAMRCEMHLQTEK